MNENEQKTEHLLNGCLYFTTAKLDRLLTTWVEEEFAWSGLAPSQAFALMTVHDRPGMNQNELAGILHLSPSTLTRFIDKLQTRKLIERHSEGRNVLLYPTEAGAAMHPRLADSWRNFWLRYTGILGMDEGNGLAGKLHQVAQTLAQQEAHMN